MFGVLALTRTSGSCTPLVSGLSRVRCSNGSCVFGPWRQLGAQEFLNATILEALKFVAPILPGPTDMGMDVPGTLSGGWEVGI